MLQDLRYVLRAVAKRPSYAVLTVLVLALAIGANATVFGVFNTFYLRPLPYPDDDRLVMVFDSFPKMGVEDGGVSIPSYLDRLDQAPSLEALAILATAGRTLGGDGSPEQIDIARASASLFAVLGVAPALGRSFTEAEATPGNESVVVLSHRIWSTRFGARPDLLGSDVRLDGQPFRVVGVMPAGFGFPNRDIEAWVPFAYTPEQAGDDQRGNGLAMSVGKLRADATIEGLNAELDAIEQRNIERLPQFAAFAEAAGWTGRARLLRDNVVGDLEGLVAILLGIVAAVLLIACANVANLQLSRVVARRKELSMRAALGADRRRLMRLVFGESLVLAALGGAGGLAVAYAGLELVRRLGLDRAREGFDFVIDPLVFGFTAGAAFLAAVLGASLPLFALVRDDVVRVLHESGRIGGGGSTAQRARGALVVVQIAVSVALLVGGGLLTKAFIEIQREGPGFNVQGLWTAGLALPSSRYATDESRARFFEQALAELRALPGVVAAGSTSTLPFSGEDAGGSIAVDGYDPIAGSAPPTAKIRSVSEGYLRALGIPVLHGRDFAASETEPVAIIDENLANTFWPAGDALGQRVQGPSEDRWYTIVGVVPEIKHQSLAGDVDRPTIYWHHEQRAQPVGAFAVRSSLPPEQLTGAARAVIAGLDPELALYDVVPMDARVERSLGPQRAPMVLTLVFAAVAFALAVVGIYGVLTWAVTQRVGEIGVRMALGARAADIVSMVLRQGTRLIAVGLVLGVVGAILLGRLLSSQIEDVISFDPMVFALAIGGLAAAALFATWLPARRAARTDPMQALRSE